MSKTELILKTSEDATLTNRGYKLLKKLSEGTYAKVYLGEFVVPDTKNIIKLACKIMDTTKTGEAFVKKFLPRELNILTKLNHPHIIHIHSIFQRKTKYFIFMRFAEKGDLLDFIFANGAVSENQSRIWTKQMALAIQYLHSLNIAHRDLKCENVLVTSNFNVKLSDFGFSRFTIDKNLKVIQSETCCGTMSYSPPEVLKCIPYNPKISDMWSLGVIIFTMINKSMPFNDVNIKTLYELQIKKKFKFRSHIVDTISENLKYLIRSLLEPSVIKRWRVTQVLNSEWLAMDSRLRVLNANETNALLQAVETKNNPEAMKLAKINNTSSSQNVGSTLMIDYKKTAQLKSALNSSFFPLKPEHENTVIVSQSLQQVTV